MPKECWRRSQRRDPPGAGEDHGAADADCAAPVALGLGPRAHRADQYLRGLLREFGVFIPVGAREVVPAVRALIAMLTLSCPMRCPPIFAEACHEIPDIEARVKQVERELAGDGRQMPVVARLLTIPGIGLLIATALMAFIVDIRRFPSGPPPGQLARPDPARLLERPQRHLGRISKRGDVYLRTLLIHGRPRPCSTHASSSPIACASGHTARPDACAQQGHRRGRQQGRAHRLGRLEPRASRTAAPARRVSTRDNGSSERTGHPLRAATAKSRDGRTGRTGAGTADNNCGPRGRCQRLASRRADSVMARGSRGLQRKRPEIRLQSAPLLAQRDPHVATA